MSGSHKGMQNLNELVRLRNQNNMCISDLIRILVCDMYDNMSRGKFNSFKEVRGRRHTHKS